MWHSFVSSTDIMANRIVLGFVETCWRYPVVTAGFLLAFLVLTAMLWIEILRKRSDVSLSPRRGRSVPGGDVAFGDPPDVTAV